MNVAILWLINENGEILLSQRAAHMSTDAGKWGPSVSGKVDDGETAEQAAVREASEELRIDLSATPMHHLHDGKHQHADSRLREFTIFYANIESAHKDEMRLEPTEVAAVKWLSLEGLQRAYTKESDTIIVSSDKQLWAEIFDNLKIAVALTRNPTEQ